MPKEITWTRCNETASTRYGRQQDRGKGDAALSGHIRRSAGGDRARRLPEGISKRGTARLSFCREPPDRHTGHARACQGWPCRAPSWIRHRREPPHTPGIGARRACYSESRAISVCHCVCGGVQGGGLLPDVQGRCRGRYGSKPRPVKNPRQGCARLGPRVCGGEGPWRADAARSMR